MGNDKSKPKGGGGPPPAAKKPAVSRTVDQASQMKQTIQRLEQRRDFIEKKATNELKLAKAKNAKKDKKGALAHLKRKKMYEKEVEKINNGILNLEQQVMTLESASVTVDIVNTMKVGKDAMKSVQAGIDVDAVAELQDDIADLQAQQNEIDEVIGTPMGMEDEDELEAELAELEAGDLEEELNALPSVPTSGHKQSALDSLPAVPTHKPATAVADDDDAALKELEAEMLAG